MTRSFSRWRVIGERLDDVGARVHELAVELVDDLRMLEHDLRHEGAGLQIAAPLELEQIAFGADHRPLVEALNEAHFLRCVLPGVRLDLRHQDTSF